MSRRGLGYPRAVLSLLTVMSPNPLLPSIPTMLTIGIVVVVALALAAAVVVWLAVRSQRRK